jgi:hypothetical protein
VTLSLVPSGNVLAVTGQEVEAKMTEKHLTMKLLQEQLDKAEKKIRNIQRKSRQPRYNKVDVQNTFWNIYRWAHLASEEEPRYGDDTSKRDAWLREFVRKEPFLDGVLSNVVSIDRNRGWSLIGGEHAVKKNVELLHKFHAGPDQISWRSFLTTSSLSYHCSDLGAISEIEWVGNNRFNSLYAVDPVLCKLSGNNDKPLIFNDTDKNKGEQEWGTGDYFRIVDMTSTDQTLNGLGVCAISRALEMAKVMVAIFDHDREKLLSKAPKGLLLLKGITEKQWVNTMEARSQMSEIERKYYDGVQVFASGEGDISADLVPLSSIPEGMDQQAFTNVVMYLYALAFKYDPREFWPVSGGQLGTATETEVQHRKATGKGGMDFSLAFQENLQNLLPPIVEFEFEARDVDGESRDATLTSQIISNIVALTNIRDPKTQEPLINFKQARMLLAENEIIPKDWADPSTLITTDKEGTGDSASGADKLSVPQYSFFAPIASGASVFFRDCVHRSLYYDPETLIVRYKESNGIGFWEHITIPAMIREKLSKHKLISIAKPKEGSTTRARFFLKKKTEEEKGQATLDTLADPEK